MLVVVCVTFMFEIGYKTQLEHCTIDVHDILCLYFYYDFHYCCINDINSCPLLSCCRMGVITTSQVSAGTVFGPIPRNVTLTDPAYLIGHMTCDNHPDVHTVKVRTFINNKTKVHFRHTDHKFRGFKNMVVRRSVAGSLEQCAKFE